MLAKSSVIFPFLLFQVFKHLRVEDATLTILFWVLVIGFLNFVSVDAKEWSYVKHF